jgi:hypothetical protein
MNYIGSARSNYFAVKDLEGFKAFLAQFGDVELIEGAGDRKGLVGFVVGRNSDSGCLPDRKPVRGEGGEDCGADEEDCDFIAEVAPHLADGQVGVVVEIGHEGLRHLAGCATAFNNQGMTRRIATGDIYELARQLGPSVTVAEY